MANRERTNCRRCGAMIEASEKALAVFMFCQTAGMKPRRKASAPVIYICPGCTMVLAIRPGPPEPDFFNFAAFEMISKLTGTQRPEVLAAFQEMFELVIEREGNILDADLNRLLPEPEILPPPKRLKEAS
jgi:hypothetical protein